MTNRTATTLLLTFLLLPHTAHAQPPSLLPPQVDQVLPGVWKIRFGTPDRFVPTAFRFEEPKADSIAELPETNPPFDPAAVRCRVIGGRCVVYVPLEKGSEIYGFGLGANAFCQRGMRKTLQVSAAPGWEDRVQPCARSVLCEHGRICRLGRYGPGELRPRRAVGTTAGGGEGTGNGKGGEG